MNNSFDNKLPDAKGFANDKTSKAQGLGEGKLNDAKGFSDGKLNDAKGFGDGKVNDAKGLGEGKVNDAKGFGEGKFNDAKGFGDGKLNDAKGFGNNFSSPAGNKNAGIDTTKSFSSQGGENKMPGASSGASGSSFNGAGGKENAAVSGGAVQNKEASMGGSNNAATSSSLPKAAPGSQAASGTTSPAVKGSDSGTAAAKPQTKYIVKPNEDLGVIAKKFRLPGWKYLYQINKKVIGDNPDFLKAGTELTIPQWDSTSGDELIREKGADPFAYTGGLQYRYPWVPFSLSLKNELDEPVVEYDDKGEIRDEYSKPKKFFIIDAKRNVKIAGVEAKKKFDEIEMLIPDAQSIIITSEEPDTRPGTLKELIKILEKIESEEGPEAASHFAFYLNYEKICELVKKGGADNDPNLMPTRFMLLPGMSDSSIKKIDNHPDSPAGKPPFQMNVANLRKSLNLLGFAVKDGSVFDASMLDPLLQYLRTLQARRKYSGISSYTVQVGDTIGSIASDFGLPTWRYLYKINKGTIGADPNVLKTGIEIEIPQWDTTSGDEKMLNAGFDVFSFCNGVGFRYPWVSFSFKMNDDSGKPMTSFSKPTKVNIIDRKSKKSLFKNTVTNFSDLEMLLPDSEDINIGIEGMSFSINETEHKYQE